VGCRRGPIVRSPPICRTSNEVSDIRGIVLGSADWFSARPLPPAKCYLELKTYLKVSAAEFAVMREEALSLAAEDAALGARRFEARYVELTCRGEPVLLVDNSSAQLFILGFIGRAIEAPCAQHLLQHWSSRLLPAD